MGERSFRKRDASSFDLWMSLFADDCAIFFNSRADLVLGASYLFNHLRRFGLMMHIGVDTTLSKTEAMYFHLREWIILLPTRLALVCVRDASSRSIPWIIDIRNADGSTVGFVDFTEEFKYLGSIIDSSLTSDADFNMRIKSATSAFGALKNVLTSLSVDLRVKGGIYNALVLSILLYGSEAWCLREDIVNRLRSFHNRCVRSMCRITMAHTMKHRITTKSLFDRLGVGSFDSYYNRRLLRWAGHVARMPMNWMPRKLLTGWVEHARPVGCLKMTWGRTLNKALKSYDIPTDFGQWSILAADRRVWQQRIGIRAPCPRPAATLIHGKWRELFNGPT
jgi:hypothetical protein